MRFYHRRKRFDTRALGYCVTLSMVLRVAASAISSSTLPSTLYAVLAFAIPFFMSLRNFFLATGGI